MTTLVDTINKLQHHGLRKTQVRLAVLQKFIDRKGEALSNTDLEASIIDIDRITLYRTLRVFEENGLIHQAIDRTGKAKYALCQDNCEKEHHSDEHAHFHCQKCDTTECIDGKIQSSVHLPENYTVQQIHLLVEGVCENCK